MNKQEFLGLTTIEQNALVSESGVLLISFDKGDTSITFYRIQNLFVKTISTSGGHPQVEVHTSQKVFNFSEFDSDRTGVTVS